MLWVLPAVLMALLLGGTALWWVNHSLRLKTPGLELTIEPGTSVLGVAQAVRDAGVDLSPLLLYGWFRL